MAGNTGRALLRTYLSECSPERKGRSNETCLLHAVPMGNTERRLGLGPPPSWPQCALCMHSDLHECPMPLLFSAGTEVIATAPIGVQEATFCLEIPGAAQRPDEG